MTRRLTRASRPRPCPAAVLMCVLALPGAPPSTAQMPMTEARLTAAAGGRGVVVLPTGAASVEAELDSGRISVRSTETATGREHSVSFNGETFRAMTPLSGPRARIAFDPARRTFVALLPSLRIELGSGAEPDRVAEVLGATRITRFESLGFAIVELPPELHPADAVARLSQMPAAPEVSVRLRGADIEWR